jgi:2-amino-4-hydroxy-6-hydroxymethyldihydropteridine diphosphokinase
MYLKKNIQKDLTLYKGKFFPFEKSEKSFFRYEAIIGIGGNMGDTKRRFEKLFFFFKKDPFLEIIKTSSILKNPPFGYLNQPFFYNAVMEIKTNLTPNALLSHLLHAEKLFQRKRSFKDAPRTLDLDILFYQNRTINTKKLTIPHKEWYKRKSVTIPLTELGI